MRSVTKQTTPVGLQNKSYARHKQLRMTVREPVLLTHKQSPILLKRNNNKPSLNNNNILASRINRISLGRNTPEMFPEKGSCDGMLETEGSKCSLLDNQNEFQIESILIPAQEQSGQSNNRGFLSVCKAEIHHLSRGSSAKITYQNCEVSNGDKPVRMKSVFIDREKHSQNNSNNNNNNKRDTAKGFRGQANNGKNCFQIVSQVNRKRSSVQSVQKQLPNLKYHHMQDGIKIIDMYSTAATMTRRDLFESPQKPQDILPHVTCASYCIMSTSNNKILLSYKSDDRRQIASITKLMTALVVYNICKQHGLEPSSTRIPIEEEAAFVEGTSANLKLGDVLTVADLLHAMLLPSGNDAAVALASFFGKFLSFIYNTAQVGVLDSVSKFQSYCQHYDRIYKKDSIKLFVFNMNRHAHQLGLKNTHFENPTGLQHRSSYSTAHDVAILSSLCSKNSLITSISAKKTYTCSIFNGKLCTSRNGFWKNTNHMLWRHRECKGLKTGNTPWAGPCLASYFKLKQIEAIVVVLKGQTTESRFSDTEKLYYWLKKHYSTPKY